MKILQICDKAPDGGGVAVHVAELTAQLERRGHQVTSLHLTSASRASPSLPPTYGLLQGYRQQAALRAVLHEYGPDLVHVHECFTTLSPVLLAQLRLRLPVVGTLHDVRPFCYLMTRRIVPTGLLCERRCGAGCFLTGCLRPADPIDAVRLVRRWFADRRSLHEWMQLDRVIAPSHYLRDLAVRHGIPSARVRVVPHGTDLRPPPDSTHDGEPLVLYVGSLIEYKGVGLLLEALKRLSERSWRAALIGEGPERERVQAELATSGLADRVEMLGHIADRQVLAAWLAKARVLVIPTVIPESFSLVGIEALAAGTPVVSFALGGIREWLRDGENGLIAADRDAGDLARQIAALLDDQQRAKAMGVRGREMVAARYTAERAFDGVLRVYEEALEERRGARPASSNSR